LDVLTTVTGLLTCVSFARVKQTEGGGRPDSQASSPVSYHPSVCTRLKPYAGIVSGDTACSLLCYGTGQLPNADGGLDLSSGE